MIEKEYIDLEETVTTLKRNSQKYFSSFHKGYQSIVGVYGEKATHKMLLSVCDDIEVIGNIHDNPELME